jgi:hypothetical protein
VLNLTVLNLTEQETARHGAPVVTPWQSMTTLHTKPVMPTAMLLQCLADKINGWLGILMWTRLCMSKSERDKTALDAKFPLSLNVLLCMLDFDLQVCH